MTEPLANKIAVANLGTVHHQTNIDNSVTHIDNSVTINEAQKVALIYSDPMPDLRFFQGRGTELVELNTWLADPSVSMIGIRGEGGIGKSTLMAKVFAESPGFAGQFWADVRSGTSITALAVKVLKELGVPPEQVQAIEEKDLIPGLLRHLQQQRYLLAIDNLESVLTATGDWQSGYKEFFKQFLTHDRQSVLLLASREYPLKYRSWHPTRWLTLGQGLKNSEGASLLEGLGVTGAVAERESVSERVAGNPLALSLIAGWLRANDSFDPHLRHLTEQTDLWQVEGDHRDQENISVDRVLQWSFDRLTPTQQYLLTQVSVLRGAFNAELATALVLEPPVSDADLHDLERRSLLQELPKRNQNGQRLFQLQPRIREFVHKQGHDLTPAHERAIAYFWKHRQTEFARDDTQDAVSHYEETFYHQCKLGQYPQAAATGGACDAFLHRRGYYQLLVNLYSQLHADWQPTPEQWQGYGTVCGKLGEVYRPLGQYQQAIEFYQQSLGIAREIDNHQGEAASLVGLGNVYVSLGRYQQAIEFYQQSLEITREIGDRSGEASSLLSLGNAYQFLRQHQQAIDFYQQSLETTREIGDRHNEASLLNNLGSVYNSLGQYQQAIDSHQQSLEIAHKIGDRHNEASSFNNLGNVYDSLGQYQKAIDFYQKSLEITHEIGDRDSEASSLGNLGNVYNSLGQYQKAIDFYQKSLEIAHEIGDRNGEAISLGNLGNAYNFLGQYRQAIEFLQQSLEIAREIGDRKSEANSLGNLGRTYNSLGQYRQAIEFLQQSLEIAREIGDRNGEAKFLSNLGNAYNSLGQYQQAIDFYQKSLEIANEIGDRDCEANSLFNQGTVLARLDRHYEALQNYQQALAIYEALKLDHMVERCETAIAERSQIIAVQQRTAPSIGTERHNDDD